MRFPYTIRQTFNGQFEIRFENLIGVREFFETETEARREALAVFAEAIQLRFENKQPIIVDEHMGIGTEFLLVPETMQELIHQHNVNCKKSGDLQDSLC
ncbi:hypothetical protein [Limnobacter sp.]|uniref:hypothetical protein n=1 Tax=Limnobacter sp. TaxID=2003368 RepID=UPI00258CA095|nr:hypothetical protein [Limnobacter sp.]